MLKLHFESVEVLGPVKNRKILKGYLNRISRKFYKRYNIDHSFFISYLYARQFKKMLKGKTYDFIFAPRASTEIALLKTSIPIVYYTDATFDNIYGYYEWFSNFMSISIREGNYIENLALNRASVCIFTSQWASESATSKYKVDPEKVHLLPFGPNMDNYSFKNAVNTQKNKDICKLLFLGVEWERKGGQIAFDAFQELKKRGLKSTLTICGCQPPEYIMDKDMVVIPFLDKNKPAEYALFEALFQEQHFLIVPTRAECFGVVFVEASAFGIPSLTTNTGGTGAAVIDGVNGYRFSLEAKGTEYADKIQEIFTDYQEKYIPLSKSTRHCFDHEFDWDVIAEKFHEIILKHLPKG
ncbi:MAG: glycosyltransferase family 4 protein [Lentimicrobium sp.]|nr:glycosyltransferase family 4 protein [Lentimicrobium sp.]